MAKLDHQHPPSDTALRVKALETVLTEKGLVDPDIPESDEATEEDIN